jgi:hypothetical protein
MDDHGDGRSKRSGTVRNDLERYGTVRNGSERSEKFGHGTVTVTSRFPLLMKDSLYQNLGKIIFFKTHTYSESFVFNRKRDRDQIFHLIPDRSGPFRPSITVTVDYRDRDRPSP